MENIKYLRQFQIEIVEKSIGIKPRFHRIYNLCRDYITDKAPDFSVECSPSDFEKEMTLFESVYHYKPYNDVYIEENILLRKIADEFLDMSIILIHGAAIAVNNRGLVFCGNSGIGKTTHIKLWLKNYPDIVVINGDKPFIKINEDEGPIIYGSPWAGKEEMNTNTCVPLQAFVFLKRAEENRIKKVTFSRAFLPLYLQVHRPEDESKMRKTIQILKSLEGKVNFYLFEVNNFKEDCFQVAYNSLINGIGF